MAAGCSIAAMDVCSETPSLDLEPNSSKTSVSTRAESCLDAGLSPPLAKRCRASADEAQVAAAAPQKTLEPLEIVTEAWHALQPRTDELRKAAQERDECWNAALHRVREMASRNDGDLAQEQETLAVARYSSEAEHFRTLPPSISGMYPLAAQSEEETVFSDRVNELRDLLAGVKNRLLSHIKDAKARGDQEMLRILGPQLGEWSKEITAARSLDTKVTQRVTIAARRISAYREKQVLRPIDTALLRDVEASVDGYTKVLDFYRYSDAACYSFGRQFDGPQHFADIRRNVAILDVWSDGVGDSVRIFNGYAVSGVDGPGVQPDDPARARFVAQEVADGLNECYLRDHDAEFKLCAAFRAVLPETACVSGSSPSSASEVATGFRGVLFSKKPLCRSCSDVVYNQLLCIVPGLKLQVKVHEECGFASFR